MARWPIRDPVNCEELFPGSEYAPDEVDYIKALDAYRRRKRRKFLTAVDCLAVAVSLGYRRVCPPEDV